MPGPADRRGALRGTSTIVDDDGIAAAGADVEGATGAATGFCVPEAEGSGTAGLLGAVVSCSCSCSCSGMGSSDGGRVVDRRPGV